MVKKYDDETNEKKPFNYSSHYLEKDFNQSRIKTNYFN